MSLGINQIHGFLTSCVAAAPKKDKVPVRSKDNTAVQDRINKIESELAPQLGISWKYREPKLAAYLELANLYLALGQLDKAEESLKNVIDYEYSLTNQRPAFYDEAIFLLADIKRIKAMSTGKEKYLNEAVNLLQQGLNQLGKAEIGYKRRYYYELLKSCVTYQCHFGHIPKGITSADMSVYYNNAVYTFNNDGPGHADNFIAVKSFIAYGNYLVATGAHEKAISVFNEVNKLVSALNTGSDNLMDNVVLEFSKQTGSKQTDPKNFRLFQALAYKGMAEAEKNNGSAQVALQYYERALEFASRLKNDFPMEFYRGTMYEERQTYYDIVVDYAEANLHSFYASKDKKYLPKAQKLAEEVIALYKEYDYDPQDIHHLKALFIVAGVYELDQKTAEPAIEAYEKIIGLLTQLKEKQKLSPYLLYLLGKALINQGSLKGNKKHNTKSITEETEELNNKKDAIKLITEGRKHILKAKNQANKGSGLKREFKRLIAESYAKEASLHLNLTDKTEGTEKKEHFKKAKEAIAKLSKEHKHLRAQVKVKEIQLFIADFHEEIGTKGFADKNQKAIEELNEARKELSKQDKYYPNLISLLQGQLIANLIQHYKKLKIQVNYIALIHSAKILLDQVSDNYSEIYMEAIIKKNSIVMQNPDFCDILTEFEFDRVSDAIAYAEQTQNYVLLAKSLLIRGEYYIAIANDSSTKEEILSKLLLAKEDLVVAKDIADPSSFIEAKAGILYALILTRFPELVNDHELAEMVFPAPGISGLSNYQEVVGSNSYLWQLSQLTKGNILLELSMPRQAYEELALVKDYDELKAKAYIQRASAISQDPKAFNIAEIRQGLKELELAQGQGSLLADSYLDLLSQALQGELYLALADQTKQKSDENTALAYLESVPKEISFIYHGARVSIISIKTRDTNKLSSKKLANYGKELQGAINSKEVKGYRLCLAHLCLARVYIAQGKLAKAREQIAKVSKNYKTLYTEACILDGVALNKNIKLAKNQIEVRLVQKRIADNKQHLEKDSYLEKYATIVQGELLFSIEDYPSAQIVFENEGLDVYPAMRGQAFVRLAQIELKIGWEPGETKATRKTRATKIIGICEQAKTKFIEAKLKTDDYRRLEVELLIASTMIMRNDKNDPIEIVKIADEIIETAETSELKPEVKTSFILQAKLKKAEALIQGRKILVKPLEKRTNILIEEALALLLEIEDSLFDGDIIGVDQHSFNAELYHQLAIAYAIQRDASLLFKYANLACEEARASKSQYDQQQRLLDIQELLKGGGKIPEDSSCK